MVHLGLFYTDRHLTHVNSENYTNTIMNDLVILITPGMIHQANHNMPVHCLIKRLS